MGFAKIGTHNAVRDLRNALKKTASIEAVEKVNSSPGSSTLVSGNKQEETKQPEIPNAPADLIEPDAKLKAVPVNVSTPSPDTTSSTHATKPNECTCKCGKPVIYQVIEKLGPEGMFCDVCSRWVAQHWA